MTTRMTTAPFAPSLHRNNPLAPRRGVTLTIVAILAMAGLLFLIGCSSASTSTSSSTSAMAPALRLALGTLDLEETDQAVSTASAARLLPLWQLLDQLETSGAAAPAEITAVVEQIESEMAPSQLAAIKAMHITDSEVSKVSLGSTSAAATASTTSGSQAVDPMLLRETGGTGGAGMPMDGGGPMSAPAMQQGSSGAANSASSEEPSLIKQVIRLLESKIQS